MMDAWRIQDSASHIAAAPPMPPQHLAALTLPFLDSVVRLAGRGAPQRPSPLTGSIAVGVVFVSGPGELRMRDEERAWITYQVLKGLTWLFEEEGEGRLTFVHDVKSVVLDERTSDKKSNGDEHEKNKYEKMERWWRDAALGKLGIDARRDLSGHYIQRLRETHGVTKAFLALFTAYEPHHYAYAREGRIVIYPRKETLHRTAIHQVFAHEACHLFGAMDEYEGQDKEGKLKKCERDNPWNKHPDARNGNCISWIPEGTQQECLMATNMPLKMCRFTRAQLGWNPRH